MSGQIFTGDALTSDVERSCEVCIVGSGAGGAVLAEALCAQGREVILLEEGGYHTRKDFDLLEATAYKNLYQDFANRATNDQAITILQGRSVGGGTTVNWSSCFRTPPHILELWRREFGIENLGEDVLTPHWEAVERRLHIQEWPLERINRNNGLLWMALGKLGYHRGLIRRNVNNCANLGYCGLGCPIDAKQSTLVTFLPDAVEKGLTLYSDARVARIETQGTRAVSVHADIMDRATRRPSGRRITVRAKAIVISCGAINSPALLLRSGLKGGGRVGKRTFLHPVVVNAARFEERIDGFSGAPQSVYSKHFIDRGPGKMGFFLEVPPIHPMLASTIGGFGRDLGELLESLPFFQAMIGITVDGLLPGDEGGTIGLRDGGERLDVEYPLRAQNFEAFQEAVTQMARLQLAAGAKEVWTPHFSPLRIRNEAELDQLAHAPWERLKLRVVTAHQMGGCAMGADPKRSVVDRSFRYRGLDNLFVVDGSVMPTALGVNPQLTIFGLARVAAEHVHAAVT